jgi:maltose O-acetyltransferase
MSLLKLLKPVSSLVSYVQYKTDRLRLARLMARGMKVGKNVYIMAGAEFDWGYPFLIEIGDNCRISKGVRILAHDATTFRDLGATRIAPVKILEGTFIGERAIIMPGVTIGPRALIAAGSFVNRDIGEGAAAAGNPARPYGKFADMLEKYSEIIAHATVFEKAEFEQGIVTPDDLSEAVKREGTAFVRGVPVKDPYYVNADYSQMRANAVEAYEKVNSQPSAAEASAC